MRGAGDEEIFLGAGGIKLPVPDLHIGLERQLAPAIPQADPRTCTRKAEKEQCDADRIHDGEAWHGQLEASARCLAPVGAGRAAPRQRGTPTGASVLPQSPRAGRERWAATGQRRCRSGPRSAAAA